MKIKRNEIPTIDSTLFLVRAYGRNRSYTVSYILFDRENSYVTGKSFQFDRMFEALQFYGKFCYNAYIHGYDKVIREKLKEKQRKMSTDTKISLDINSIL